MPNELLEKYIEDPKVLYIYETGLQIYGLFEDVEDRDFLVIVTDDCDYENTYNGYNFTIVKIKDWFERVLDNSMIAWECACLPKKYILKEHVKLLLQTDPLKLRKMYDAREKVVFSELRYDFDNGNTLTAQKRLFGLIKYLVFANQIIENHKIVNYKIIGGFYKQMVDGTVCKEDDILLTYHTLVYQPLQLFKQNTDSILRSSKIKKIIQNG